MQPVLLPPSSGELLLQRDPPSPASADEAFQTALAIAKQKGARSWALRAALKLAKLYQSTARPVEAHDILSPALEGFAPTREMPEIAEAQALLASLAETEEVKTAAASRQRRLQLQTSYGKALMLCRGFASEEPKAAFAHAQELAQGVDNAAERFDAYFGQWVGSMLRGELQWARENAETFLSETGEGGADVGNGGSPLQPGHDALLSGRSRGGPSPFRGGAEDIRPRMRSRGQVSVRHGHRRRCYGLPRLHNSAARRGRTGAEAD